MSRVHEGFVVARHAPAVAVDQPPIPTPPRIAQPREPQHLPPPARNSAPRGGGGEEVLQSISITSSVSSSLETTRFRVPSGFSALIGQPHGTTMSEKEARWRRGELWKLIPHGTTEGGPINQQGEPWGKGGWWSRSPKIFIQTQRLITSSFLGHSCCSCLNIKIS